MDRNILVEYAHMKEEIKDLRRRIEQDRKQLAKLESMVVSDSVSCGKKGKKSLGTVRVTGMPEASMQRKKLSLKRKLALLEDLEADLLEKQAQAEEYIQQIEKSELRMIFRFYFLDDLTYTQTAQRMNTAFPKRKIPYTDENIRKKIQRFFEKN